MRRRGITLLEVQLAMMLLLIGVLAVVAMAPTGLRSVKQSERSTLTIAYARHVLESTLARKFPHQINVPTSGAWPDLSTLMPSVPAGLYTYSVQVGNLAGNAEIHTVMVTIKWSDSNANGTTSNRTISLVGYSAKTD